mgnify:CR=1 FL=1
MIVNTTRGDVFQAPHKHIAFAVNTEGYNDAGFAGAVSSRYWPELANTGTKKLGDALMKNGNMRSASLPRAQYMIWDPSTAPGTPVSP